MGQRKASQPKLCQYIRGQSVVVSPQRLGRDKILGGGLASLAVGYDLVRDLLPLVEAVQPCPLDGADVNEHVISTVIRLDEAEALLAVEPLHGPCGHLRCLLSIGIHVAALFGAAGSLSGFAEGRQQGRFRARGQFVRPKLDG